MVFQKRDMNFPRVNRLGGLSRLYIDKPSVYKYTKGHKRINSEMNDRKITNNKDLNRIRVQTQNEQ